MNQPRVYMCPTSRTSTHLPPHPIPLGCPSALALSALFHASNLDWSSISHMVIYMFQCCSLKSCHPCLLLQSPKVCSLYLCLFCCLAYRVISEKAMAAHSGPLAWKIPWTEEPGRLQSVGSLRIGHNWATSLSRIGEGNGNHSSVLAWRIPGTRDGGAWWAAVYGVPQSQTQLKWLSSSSSSSST